mgnify:CR=1 FL=1
MCVKLIAGEVTTTGNLKYRTTLIPQETLWAVTSNYALSKTYNLKQEEK